MKFILVTTLALAPLLAKDNEPAKRLDEAAAVFSEVMGAPDKGIPQELLENAHCIVIVPDLKTGAFIIVGHRRRVRALSSQCSDGSYCTGGRSLPSGTASRAQAIFPIISRQVALNSAAVRPGVSPFLQID
jgi:hypothetical protein